MSTIGIFDTEVFAGIVEGAGEQILDVHFMIDPDSGLTIQESDNAVQIRKNDPFCIPLPEEFRSQSEVMLLIAETNTGRSVWESKRQLGVSFYNDLGEITHSPQLQLSSSQAALEPPVAPRGNNRPAAVVIAIILLVVAIVLIPQAIQQVMFRTRSKRSTRRMSAPKPLPTTVSVPVALTHASSISSLSSLANDTSSESASVTTERSDFRRSTGSTHFYPSQLRRRSRPSLAVHNPYEGDAAEGSGPALKSAGLTTINSKIFCEDDVYG